MRGTIVRVSRHKETKGERDGTWTATAHKPRLFFSMHLSVIRYICFFPFPTTPSLPSTVLLLLFFWLHQTTSFSSSFTLPFPPYSQPLALSHFVTSSTLILYLFNSNIIIRLSDVYFIFHVNILAYITISLQNYGFAIYTKFLITLLQHLQKNIAS